MSMTQPPEVSSVSLILLLSCLAVQPGWAIVCYHCDSIALPECAQTLGEVDMLPYIECTADLSCAMSIVDSITYRGCGMETPMIQATYRKSCNTNLCNAGVYPPGRLKCYHCNGEECVDVPEGKPRPCRDHHEEDQCYTEVINATLAYRGCVSDSNHTTSSAAQLCDINGCNAEQGAWTLSCVQCDSEKRLGCKIDLFQLGTRCNISQFDLCQQQLLLGQEQQYCFTYRNLERVVRGCSSAVPADIEPYRDQLVHCASDNNCNANCMPQQTCLNCNSVDKELCRSNATALSSNTCGSGEASSCYACEYDDWSVRRGCGIPPSSEQILNCYVCDGDSKTPCNSLDFTRCYRCNSDDADGAGCANWERPGGIYIEECEVPASPCLVLNFVNGTTKRGCQREDFNCNTTSVANCRSCQGNFCNKGAFPEQRLWCHQCTNCNQIVSGQDALPCGQSANEPTDQPAGCLEYFDEYIRQIVRGCRSNAQLYYECMLRSNSQAGCRMCHSNGCNSTPRELLQFSTIVEEKALAFRSSACLSFKSTTSMLLWFGIIYQFSLN